MNSIKSQIINILNDLKNNYCVTAIKAEFEAEGACLEEAMLLKGIAEHVSLDFTIKIGGCQAIKELYEAKSINANTVVAPMIESPYALKKFAHAINTVYTPAELNSVNFWINIETITGFRQLDDIFDEENFKYINGVVFGRGDMVQSLGMKKDTADSGIILDYAKAIGTKVREYGKEFCVGGMVTPVSLQFFKNLPYIDKFETRKIIFNAKPALQNKNIADSIFKAIEFEILWLKFKKENYCHLYKNTDNERLNELERRFVNLT